ncbi:unnamed protein product, partial [Mesorhabditis belari]|uniref:Uncharacterized protein n=1 Tax=Mesorhabditis belari TaxID=2138241 RepID=A0AAF3EKC6_9BILA
MYGDDNQDDRIPTSFYSTEQDFMVEKKRATSKLNDWQTYALIVIYTASSQTLVNVAGTNYTEQARTVAIHQNDGIDLRPISNYPSYQMSDYTNIVDLITIACKHFPMKTVTIKNAIYDLNAYNGDESIAGAALHLNDWQEQNVVIVLFTQSPQTEIDLAASEYLKKVVTLAIPLDDSLDLTNLAAVIKSAQDFPGIGDAIEDLCLRRTKTTSPAPISTTFPTRAPTISPLDPSICYGLFVFDGSKQVTDFVSEQSLGRIAAIQAYHNLDYPFNGNVWMYGSEAGDETIPTTFIETYDEIGDLILGLVSYNGNENVTGAVNQLNAWSENEAIIMLYSASNQVDIDAAAKIYRKKTSTVGLSWQDRTDLSKLAAVTVSPTDFDGVKVALNTLCQAKLATTTGSTPKTIVV